MFLSSLYYSFKQSIDSIDKVVEQSLKQLKLIVEHLNRNQLKSI